MNACPNPETDLEFRELVNKLNSGRGSKKDPKHFDLAMKAAYRVWSYYEALYPQEGSKKALENFSRPTESKLEDTNKLVRNIVPPKPGDEDHTYRWAADSNVELRSMSQELDNQLEEERFHKTSTQSVTSKAGSLVHDLFSIIVKTDAKATDANAIKWAKDNNLPGNTVAQLVKLKDDFKEMGDLVSEQVLYAEGAQENVAIVGQSDLVIYGKDGKKHIVDLKTAYRTKAVKAKIAAGEIKSAWNPHANYGQKGKRYTAQTLGYGRMTEFADRQAVTGHFIVPIEIELVNDEDLSKGFVSMEVLPRENVADWGYTQFATDLLDKMFNVSSNYNPTTLGVIGVDDTSMIYSNLTGDISSGTSYTEMAKNVRRDYNKSGVYGYYTSDGTFVPFKSQDAASQLKEIENDYIRQRGRITNDLSHGVKNFLETDDDKYIESVGDHKKNLRKLLKPFIGRVGRGLPTDVKVINLSEIPGFKDKKNWILIEEGKTRHLYHISADNITQTFDTNKFLMTSSTSLFASKHLGAGVDGPYVNNTINSSLQNNLGDARAFEGTLIAIKLKDANPEINFGTTIVHGLGGGGNTTFIDLKENLETIGRIIKEPSGKIRNRLFGGQSGTLKIIGKPGALNYDNYRTDFLQLLKVYMEFRRPDPSRDQTWERLTGALIDSSKNAIQRKKILEQIGNYLNRRIALGRDSETDYEMYLLSSYYLQMQKMDVSMLPSEMYRTWAGISPNIAQPMLQHLFQKLNTAINKMTSNYWNEYKTEFAQALTEYLSSKGIVEGAQDRFTGNTQRHYAELFIPYKDKFIRNADGTEIAYNGPSFNLKQKGTPEYNALSPEAQRLIDLMNGIIMKLAKRNDIKWREGNFPLANATSINRLRNAAKVGGNAYTLAVDNMLRDLDTSFGAGYDAEPTDGNMFASQSADEISDGRDKLLGISTDGKYINPNDFNRWSTDIEHTMDVYVIQGLKHEAFNEIGPMMRAVHSVFQWHRSNLLEKRLGLNIDWVKHAKTINLDNMSIDSNTTADKGSRLVNRIASAGMYALAPLTAGTAFIGNELTLLSQTLGNALQGVRGAPGIGDYMKAKAILTPILTTQALREFTPTDYNNMSKIDLLMRKFRMFNHDISSLLNGYHKAGDKFLFRSKFLYSLLQAGDYVTRANYLVAQMIADGSWEAFDVVNGKLVYTESKDKRWGADSMYTPEERVALKQAIAESTQNEGFDGYDDNMINSIRNTANYLMGSNDRESRAIMNHTWWGRLLLASKGWLAAKIDRWFLGLGSNRINESRVMGHWDFQRDSDGKLHPFWQGEMQEGILMSLLAGFNYIRTARDQRVPLTSTQKNNLLRLVGDIVLLASARLIAGGIRDDDDETTVDDYLANILRWGSDDLLTLYTLMSDPSFLWDPVSLGWLAQSVSNVFEGIYEQRPEAVLEVIPGVNKIDDWNEIMFDEDFEIETI